MYERMKKTLLVTLDFYPNVGGVASYWRSLAEHMPPEQWIVLAPPLPKGTEEIKVPYHICRKKLLSPWLSPRWLPLIFHIFMVARVERVEHIIAGQILPVGTATRLVSFFLRI